MDVPSLTITLAVGDRTIKATMPKSAQEALMTGAWDATGMLLDQYQEVEAVAPRRAREGILAVLGGFRRL